MGKEPPLQVQMVGNLAIRQMKLIGDIGNALKEVNALRPFILLKSIDGVDNNLSSIQEEAIQLDRVFDQPDIVLAEKKEKREGQRKELEKDPTIMYNYLQMVSIGEPQIRHRRIFTLLEHLERRISDKRQAVYLNRTILIGIGMHPVRTGHRDKI